MNSLISSPRVLDGDLTISKIAGVAWQTDMTITADYDQDYFNKCASYEGTGIADSLNVFRTNFVKRHYGDGLMVDVGIGSGEFIRSRPNTVGRDINPIAIQWMIDNDKLADDSGEYQAFSFWDVIEHIPDPECILGSIPVGAFAFFSIPVFENLWLIRESKHYRPGEHLYYWTRSGFIAWMLQRGFYLLETNNIETIIGRESIESFAFRKVYR